jgi:6-pyruvoyltetrahydropterin/6-carboxytetrahydropterin synthase
MVIDFTDLKKIVKEEIVDEFDHMFSMKLHLIELARIKKPGHHVILVDYQPTSENMVVDFAQKIKEEDCQKEFIFSKITRNRIFICRMVLQAIICNHIPNLTACN